MPVMILRCAFRIFSGRGARFLGAAVAFYAIASIAPLFVVVLHAVGAIFGRHAAEGTLFQSLGHWLAPEGVDAVRDVTLKLDASEKTHTVAGVLLVLYASTRLFRSLKRALNHLWSIDAERIEKERKAPIRYARRYATAALLLALVIAVISALTATKLAIVRVVLQPPERPCRWPSSRWDRRPSRRTCATSSPPISVVAAMREVERAQLSGVAG
jgi:uncharacterized BrkB/YihY/UPF0761 family membrane protein